MSEIKFCGNCGTKLIENAEFCGNCGTKVEPINKEYSEEETVSVSKEKSNASAGINEQTENLYWELPTNNPIASGVNGQGNVQQPKKKNTVLIIGIVAAILLVLISIGAVIENSNSDKKDDMAYSDYDMTETEKLLGEIEDSQIETENVKKTYSKGILTATSYESSYFDLKFNAPEGWVMQTADEISEQYGEDTDLLKYEMSASNAYSGEVIVVSMEKLPSKNLTIEQYIDISIINMQETAEFEILSRDGTKVIAGNTYNTMSFNITDAASGLNVNADYYVRKVEDRIICIMTMYLPGNQANAEVGINAFTTY